MLEFTFVDDILYLRLIGIAALLIAAIAAYYLPLGRVQILSFPAIAVFILIVLWDRTVFRERHRLLWRLVYAVGGAITAAVLFSLVFPVL